MQHMVNKADTRRVAANMISGHLAHAGNYRHGTAGPSQGWCSAQKAVVWAKTEWLSRGASGPVLRCNAGQL